MADRNDYIPVSASNTLRVASRNDKNNNQHDQKKNKQDDKKDIELKTKKGFEKLEPTELIEFGRILLHKRNTELKLFALHKNYDVENHSDLENNTNQNIALLKLKIASYEKDIQEMNMIQIHPQVNDDIQDQFNLLEKIYELYKALQECVKEERKILNIDEIDFLDVIIKQKDTILNKCDELRNQINFQLFTNLSEQNPIKLKYDSLMENIRNLVNVIIEFEDENSTELHNLKEKMKLILSKQDLGVRTVTQYTQTAPKSHFIDKKQ